MGKRFLLVDWCWRMPNNTGKEGGQAALPGCELVKVLSLFLRLGGVHFFEVVLVGLQPRKSSWLLVRCGCLHSSGLWLCALLGVVHIVSV